MNLINGIEMKVKENISELSFLCSRYLKMCETESRRFFAQVPANLMEYGKLLSEFQPEYVDFFFLWCIFQYK